jgi:hypothetical protein
VNTTVIRHTIAAALAAGTHLKYAALSGKVLADLQAGRVIRVSTHLERLGIDPEWIHRYGSPYGRHVARHYRARTGREPLSCWVRNEAGRFIHVFVYHPGDFALAAAITTYQRAALALAA